MAENSNENVYVCCQQTIDAFHMLYPGQRVKTSGCGFNTENRFPYWDEPAQDLHGIKLEISHLDAPVYGYATKLAVCDLLDLEIFRSALQEEGILSLTMVFEPTWIKSRLRKLDIFLQALARSTEVTSHPAAAKIYAFLTAFSKIESSFTASGAKGMPSFESWNKFILRQGLPEDWSTRTHWDEVLQLFGASDSLAKEINGMWVGQGRGGWPCCTGLPKSGSTMAECSVKYLSKLLTCFGPAGCLTDIVNLAFVLLGKEADKKMGLRDCDVAQNITELSSIINQEKYSLLHIPSTIMHDSERDDLFSSVICRELNRKLYRNLAEIIQLPHGQEFDTLAEYYSQKNVTIFRDPHSRNGEALKSFWNWFLQTKLV